MNSNIELHDGSPTVDDICFQMKNTSMMWYPSRNFVADLHILTGSIVEQYNSGITSIDIYDIILADAEYLGWNVEYYISCDDYNWFRTSGKVYFTDAIINNLQYNTIIQFTNIFFIHEKLEDLFKLQIMDQQ